jgi:UDP-glucose 4-epimerase
VFISGMGSELGSLVALRLEALPWVAGVIGIDRDPPRRRLQRAEFHMIDPADDARTLALVTAFDPEIIVHLGIWEPNARADPRTAERNSATAAAAVFDHLDAMASLRHVVVRSGIEVYGRGRHRPSLPDETSPVAPTSTFGRILQHTEAVARRATRAAGIPLGTVRLAPVVGPHLPSPLGRLLRLPVVPVHVLHDPAFSVVDLSDAADALVAAAHTGLAEPVNVVGAGTITPWAAARLGGRVPLPIVGPLWAGVRAITAVAGAPVPDHVTELLRHGRTADGRRCAGLLGAAPDRSTADAIRKLYEWPSVTHKRASAVAAPSDPATPVAPTRR